MNTFTIFNFKYIKFILINKKIKRDFKIFYYIQYELNNFEYYL